MEGQGLRKLVGRKAEWQGKGLDNEGLRRRLDARDCSNVEKLDLSFNFLTTLSPAFPALLDLDVRNNNFTSLDWLALFPDLERVRVSGNPLSSDLQDVTHYHLVSICPKLGYIDGVDVKNVRQAVPWLTRTRDGLVQQACAEVLPRFARRGPLTEQDIDDATSQVWRCFKQLVSTCGRTVGQQKFIAFRALDLVSRRVRESLPQFVLPLTSTDHSSGTGPLKRKSAAEVRARRERRQQIEEERRRRDARRYEVWRAKRDAGVQLGVEPYPTCCPCFDNCQIAGTLNDYRSQRKINMLALNELFPVETIAQMRQLIIDDPMWHFVPRGPTATPTTTPTPATTAVVTSPPATAAALVKESTVHMQRFQPSDAPQPGGRSRGRKSRRPQRVDLASLEGASEVPRVELDLNEPAKEDPISACQKRLAYTFPFVLPDSRTIQLTPTIIGRRKLRTTPTSSSTSADEEPPEHYLVRYSPEDILPDAWLPEDEATKVVEKQLSELGPWGFHRLMSSLPNPPPREAEGDEHGA